MSSHTKAGFGTKSQAKEHGQEFTKRNVRIEVNRARPTATVHTDVISHFLASPSGAAKQHRYACSQLCITQGTEDASNLCGDTVMCPI